MIGGDLSVFECENYYELTELEKLTYKLKWIFLIMLIIRIPWCFFSFLSMCNMAVEVVTIIIGLFGIKTLKKLFLVLYCTLSEVSFFLSSYDICQFLEIGDNNKFNLPYSFRILFTILFIIWSLFMFFSIKLVLDLFQTQESKPLLISFAVSTDSINDTTNNTDNESVI
ncbi:hypothetical protein RB653_005598 [Dictyostelium firmibasis]|uniref:Transmembrane protein n=1 Tax=Dictyostelium firmibasis TaxID=79012 RepID=A0AAN7U9T6_9MYCE